MSATLATAPQARALTKSPIWIGLETDLITGVAAYFEITITTGGPSAAETLVLTWPGGTITYTVDATPDNSGLQWPTQGGGESLTDYTNRIGDFLRQREDVGEVFDVTVTNPAGGVIRLTSKTVEAFDISVTDGLTNVAVTANDGTAASAEDNLRAFVEVWSDTGAFNTDQRLISLHSPYDIATEATELDISAAFAGLKPHLPDDTSIQIGLALSLTKGVATDVFTKYYLRYADKYGAPAVAEALVKSADSWLAILGSYAGDYQPDGSNTETYIRHNYRRRAAGYDFFTATTSKLLRRPIALTQPDWVYLFLYEDAVGETSVTGPTVDVYVECLLYWSDGTTSTYQPFDTDPTTLDIDTIYWIISGYRQLKIHNVTPSGGTAADAFVVAYDWILKRDSDNVALAAVYYKLQYLPGWDYFLLFSNGQGGCETACFRGKGRETYRTTAEKYRSPRASDWEVQTHEYQVYALEGQREWELQSGWTDDPDWIEHLRQLCLSDAVWLIDVENERFLAVTVETRDIEVRRDDETLYNLPITVRASWVDVDANV